MKFLIFLLAALSSVQAVASFVSVSDVSSSSPVFYTDKGKCQKITKEKCYKWERGMVPGAVDLKKVMVDDLSSPIWGRREKVESCPTTEQCQAMLEAHCVEEQPDLQARFDDEQMRVFCQELEGYEQKLSEEPRLVKAANHDAKMQEVIEHQERMAKLRQVREARKAGQEVIDLMILRNQEKGLSPAQRKQVLETYGDIKALLEVGNLAEAKAAIEATSTDGVLVTAADKTALKAAIDKHLE